MLVNEERTFGIELEVIKPTVGPLAGHGNVEIAGAFRRQTNFRVLSTGYTHSDSETTWKIATDSSIGAHGAEFVSPILKGRQGLADVVKACEFLTRNNFTVSTACGCHVHVGYKGLANSEIKAVYARYGKFEHELEWMFAKSRRAITGRTPFNERIDRYADRPELQDESDLDDVDFFDRRQVLSLATHVNGHETIEFRQHQGTTDAEKATNFVAFAVAFTEASVARKRGGATEPLDVLSKIKKFYTKEGSEAPTISKAWLAAELMLNHPEGLTRRQIGERIGQNLTQVSVIFEAFKKRGYGLKRRGVVVESKYDSSMVYWIEPPMVHALPAVDTWQEGLPDSVRAFWEGRIRHFKQEAGVLPREIIKEPRVPRTRRRLALVEQGPTPAQSTFTLENVLEDDAPIQSPPRDRVESIIDTILEGVGLPTRFR